MKISAAFPSNYLKCADLGGRPRAAAERAELSCDGLDVAAGDRAGQRRRRTVAANLVDRTGGERPERLHRKLDARHVHGLRLLDFGARDPRRAEQMARTVHDLPLGRDAVARPMAQNTTRRSPAWPKTLSGSLCQRRALSARAQIQ